MRQILFKARRVDNGEWVEGFYVICRSRHYILPLASDSYLFGTDERYVEWVEIDPATLCQYTGLTDKNGVKIFEGDICHTGYATIKIIWSENNAAFMVEFQNSIIDHLASDVKNYYEVIGSIHTAPELMGNDNDSLRKEMGK